MRNDLVKYISTFLLCFIFLLKGIAPVLPITISGKSQVEMMADIETEDNKKTSRSLLETELPELYFPLHYFTALNHSIQPPASKIRVELKDAYKKQIIISVPTPPPENV